MNFKKTFHFLRTIHKDRNIVAVTFRKKSEVKRHRSWIKETSGRQHRKQERKNLVGATTAAAAPLLSWKAKLSGRGRQQEVQRSSATKSKDERGYTAQHRQIYPLGWAARN